MVDDVMGAPAGHLPEIAVHERLRMMIQYSPMAWFHFAVQCAPANETPLLHSSERRQRSSA
jgi:hypothetical protein